MLALAFRYPVFEVVSRIATAEVEDVGDEVERIHHALHLRVTDAPEAAGGDLFNLCSQTLHACEFTHRGAGRQCLASPALSGGGTEDPHPIRSRTLTAPRRSGNLQGYVDW